MRRRNRGPRRTAGHRSCVHTNRRGERPDPARANSPRDLPERCPNRLLWGALDRSKVPSGNLALHDIIDEGERSVGFEHPAGFCFQMVAALTLSAQSVGIAPLLRLRVDIIGYMGG
jgi:hypothetical protein